MFNMFIEVVDKFHLKNKFTFKEISDVALEYARKKRSGSNIHDSTLQRYASMV